MKRALLLGTAVFCLSFLLAVFSASAAGPIILTPDRNSYPVGLYLEILDDPERQYTIEEVSSPPLSEKFRPSKVEVPNFGFSSSAHWLRFTVVNKGNDSRQWVLELQAPTVDHADLFVSDLHGRFARSISGDLVPMKEWDIECRYPAFRLTLPPGKSITCFMLVESAGLIRAKLVLSTEREFEGAVKRSAIKFGLFMGCLGIVILFNILFWVTLRERIHLYYVLSTLFIGLFIAVFSGWAYQYLWPNYPVWGHLSLMIFIGLMLFGTALFTRDFLNSKEYTAYLDYLAQALAVLGLVIFVSCLFAYRTSVLLSITGLAAGIILFFIIAVKGLLRGYRYAVYYLVSYLVLFFCLVSGILAVVGVFPVTGYFKGGMAVGLPITLLVLSLAMGDRFMHIQRQYSQVLEEEVAQRTRELDDALAKLAGSHEDLEQRVEERTAELLGTTEQLRLEMNRSKQAHETLEAELRKFEATMALIRSVLDSSRPAVVSGFETKRHTRDGRLLEVSLSGSL